MPTGTRKLTPALDAARAIAEQYPQAARISKKEAVTTVMRVAAALGLPAGVQALLNTLFAASNPRDWDEPEGRPIVWPSNERLCQQLGLALPTLRRFIRILVDTGLIVPCDSPNGKRWGRRDTDGRIIVAYGFDLSPIAVRYDELRELATRLEHQRVLLADLRRTATILRKRIEMAILAGREARLPGDWPGFQVALSHLVMRYPRLSTRRELEPEISRLRRLTGELQMLVDMVEGTFRTESQAAELTPMGANSDTHILITTQSESQYSCNENRHRSNERSHKIVGTASGRAFERKPEGVSGGEQDLKPDLRGSQDHSVPLELVVAACPEILGYAQTPVRTWKDLVCVASQVRPWLGISPDAWGDACEALGDSGAAAAVAVILEKQTRAQIRSPGGYLRGMVSKAHEGQLHLTRTLHGLVSRHGSA
jgi:replication initiation protein RepC